MATLSYTTSGDTTKSSARVELVRNPGQSTETATKLGANHSTGSLEFPDFI